MLEAAIVLELALGKYVEAAIIAALLVFNAALGLFQESRAQATLAALKSRLALNASVRRDGAWKTVPATELVPGDVVKLSLGGVVAADVKLTGGEILLDQSMLTGESVPIEAGAGVRDLCRSAGAARRGGGGGDGDRRAHQIRPHARSWSAPRMSSARQQKAVLRVVRNLAGFNGVVIVVLVAYAWFLKMPLDEIIPLVLTAVLASIPVALPATFTLAAALGARALAKRGVLPTRLSAVDEAASMDVLCADKTGTLTRNALTVTSVRPMPGFDERACSGAGRAGELRWRPGPGRCRHSRRRREQGRRRCAALIKFAAVRPGHEDVRGDGDGSGGGSPQRIVKGAFAVGRRLSSSRRRTPRRRRRTNSKPRDFACWRSRPARRRR